jgi:hypothetical protein
VQWQTYLSFKPSRNGKSAHSDPEIPPVDIPKAMKLASVILAHAGSHRLGTSQVFEACACAVAFMLTITYRDDNLEAGRADFLSVLDQQIKKMNTACLGVDDEPAFGVSPAFKDDEGIQLTFDFSG